jgi:hypothetical protein
LDFLWLSFKVVLQDGLGAIGITGLSIKRGSRVVGHHAVASAKRVLHGAPDVILGSWLDIPNVTCIARELTALESFSDGFLVTDGSTSGVDQPCAFLEVLQQLCIYEASSPLVQWAVYSDDIALRNKFLKKSNV